MMHKVPGDSMVLNGGRGEMFICLYFHIAPGFSFFQSENIHMYVSGWYFATYEM